MFVIIISSTSTNKYTTSECMDSSPLYKHISALIGIYINEQASDCARV